MEATDKVQLRSLKPYRHLFPDAIATDSTIKKGADVFDTVHFIPEIISKCLWQVEKYVNQELKDLPVYDACEKLWNFVKYHIEYKKDKRGYEQVRSPRRLIHDAVGDCDCFTTFIGTCLTVLEIPFANRITKYGGDNYQHIYPIVPLGNGKYITMDCVVPSFNYEEPYTEKKDYKMDLQFLDGIDERRISGNGIDAQDLFEQYEDDDLGKININLSKVGEGIKNVAQNVAQTVSNAAQNVAQTVKEAVQSPQGLNHALNQVNPAAGLLRLGFLASLKLNIGDIAGKLRWVYLSREAAEARGIEPSKYDQLVNIHKKAEDVFYSAGGQKENLREAILTSKGNPNGEVSGFGYTSNLPLRQILGPLYQREYPSSLNGTQGLGEVATAAAIAAAAAAIGALAALVKSVGDVFKKKADDPAPVETPAETSAPVIVIPQNDDFTIPDDIAAMYNNAGDAASNISSAVTNVSSAIQSFSPGNADVSPGMMTTSSATPGSAARPSNSPSSTNNSQPNSSLPATNNIANSSGEGIQSFWEKNKSWIKPVGIGTAVIGVAVGGYMLVKKNKANKGLSGLNGIKKRKGGKKFRKGKRKGSKKSGKRKSLIALM